MTLTVLIFGEITPKSIATHYPEKVSLLVLNMISIATFIFKPFVFLLDKIRDMIFKIFRIDSEIDNDAITEETLKTLVEVSHEEGLIEEEKKEIINNVFEFGEMVAKEAMINRMDVIGVDKTISHREIIEIFKEQKFTRMPIYDENIDSIIGIINVKDIAFLSDEEIENFDITNYSRDAFFTYEFKSVSTLLEEMKAKKTHMSVVVDEYGGTAGILTIENLVEQIVGDIEDEHDAEEADSGIVTISENEFVVKGSVHLSDINDKTGLELESENFDSIGGFIIDNLEGFPKANEVISIENTDYIIEDVDKNKINRIKIKIKNIGEGAMA
jgi:putative hemolysin